MFIYSFKVTRLKIFCIAAAVLLAVLTTVLMTLPADNPSNKNIKSLRAENNQQRREFLQSFGWSVSTEPVEIVEVLIPNSFDDVYNNYNLIQKANGFDLSKYKGKTVKRYCYEVINYEGEKNVHANLLIYNGKIIGGDICSSELDGFMHGFDRNAKVESASSKSSK